MGEKEKSAIDVIYDLNDWAKDFEKRLDIIDENIKLINNKLRKVQGGLRDLKAAGTTSAGTEITSTPDVPRSGKVSSDYVTGKIKVYGRIAAKNRRPIPDVRVVVYNEDGDAIKTRQTDSDGYWEVRLPAGKFGVEYIHDAFKPINLVVNLTDDMKEYEVK